jgi:hypothetical protein
MRRGALLGLFGIGGLVLAGACTSRVALGPEAVAGKTPDGTVELSQVQVAYIGGGSTGRGSSTTAAGPTLSTSMGSVSAASVPPRSKRPARSTTSRTPHESGGLLGRPDTASPSAR